MNKIIVLIMFLTLLSCSSQNVAGGVSEAGNGFIQISVVSTEGKPLADVSVVLTPSDYMAQSRQISLPIVKTDSRGKALLSADIRGLWNIYAEQNGSIVLFSCSVTENDTAHFGVTMTAAGTVYSESTEEIVIPGAPRKFIPHDNRTSLPSGTYELFLKESSGVVFQQEVLILPNETAEIAPNGSKIIIATPEISSVYNVAFDGERIAYATGGGLVLESFGVRKQYTKENSPLLSNWIRDVAIFGDTVIAATDSGITIFTENDTAYLRGGREIPDDWVIHFLQREGELWFVTQAGIGVLAGGEVAQVFTGDNSPLPSAGIAALSEDSNGGILVGTQSGVFSYQNGIWQEESGFLSGNLSLSVTAIGGTWDDLWVTTNGSGLFHKVNDIWASYSDTTLLPGNSLHSLIVQGDSIIAAGASGALVTGAANNLSMEQITQGDIVSLNYRDDGSLWLGTLYEGVVVIMK